VVVFSVVVDESPPGAALLVVVVEESVVFDASAGAAAVSAEGAAGTTSVSFVVSLHPTTATPAKKTIPTKAADLHFFIMIGIEARSMPFRISSVRLVRFPRVRLDREYFPIYATKPISDRTEPKARYIDGQG
jgi:hypothetical protein